MAIKKSQLYSALWESSDALRGGMDASQYKDYVLTILFLKYISDKQKADPDNQLFVIPEGCTFDDIVKLKGHDDIGDTLNKKLEKIGDAFCLGSSFFHNADFNDPKKLGSGRDLVDRVSGLIEVFQNPALDFGHNRAADDDLIGDAYEYLMRKFAQDSGKSKGQFYTPAEASRLAAALLDIKSDTSKNISIYDMTCGSGSLLLRAAHESNAETTTLYGQEYDIATLQMAEMNMILHGMAGSHDLKHGDTINNPQHKDPLQPDTKLMTFDYCVANPPYSVKHWRKSAKENDDYGRWNNRIGIAPDSKGDYAFLMHMIKSMKSTGRGSCFLPHGVLSRGESEAMIRKYLVDQHLISGIIGLPANIFYGTGIPTCIIVIDKAAAHDSKGIFMIDAKDGYRKDGDKNRLREQDIRRVCDTWFAKKDVPHYAKMVLWDEIKANDYNLNIPRYVTPADKEPKQDLFAHLNGGVPQTDVDAITTLWQLCPSLKTDLFMPTANAGYVQFTEKAKENMDATIQQNASYKQQEADYQTTISKWEGYMRDELPHICIDCTPKTLIDTWGNDILSIFGECKSLVDEYDVYDELYKYWDETMQDDAFMISRDGWKITISLPKDKKGNIKKNFTYEDIACDLLPSMVLVKARFAEELSHIESLTAAIEMAEADMDSMAEEESDSFAAADFFNDKNKIKLSEMKAALKAAKKDPAQFEKSDIEIWTEYVAKADAMEKDKKALRKETESLTKAVQDKYAVLTEDEVRELVFTHKWMSAMRERLTVLMATCQQHVSSDMHALNARYENTLDQHTSSEKDFESTVMSHLNDVQQLLTGKKRLDGFSEPWVEKKLGEMLSYEQPTNYLVHSTKYVDSGTPVLTAGKTFILGYTNETFGIYDKLPVIIFDDFTTDSRFVTFPFKAKSSAMKMLKANDGYDTRFVYELLQIIDYTPGDHQRHWISMFADFSILVPPTINEQIAISNILSSVDNEIFALEAKKAKYESIKKGMMQELLTGKIRLV